MNITWANILERAGFNPHKMEEKICIRYKISPFDTTPLMFLAEMAIENSNKIQDLEQQISSLKRELKGKK